jgi:hypothetical protein
MSNQQSNTRGKQSTAQKRDSSRHGFGPIPATTKVDGASGGNEPVGRTATEVMDHYTAEEMAKQAESHSAETESADEKAAFNPVIESMPEKPETTEE